MRIGDVDSLNKSQEAENLADLIRSDSRETMTKAEKRKNWWHYYKWYVVCGILLLMIVCNMIGNALGFFEKSPGFQIAYVGRTELPQDTISALEQAFASIAGDFNGDGEIVVKVNQYVSGSEMSSPDTVYSAYASEVTLIGDISACESYFFLTDDPDSLQKNFEILEGEVILWEDCSVLADMELGSYSVDLLGQTLRGSNQELLAKLSLGRRYFYNDERTENVEECRDLWDYIARAK